MRRGLRHGEKNYYELGFIRGYSRGSESINCGHISGSSRRSGKMLLLKCRLEVLKLINLSDEGATEGLFFFEGRGQEKQ